jgi:hypothetical protein
MDVHNPLALEELGKRLNTELKPGRIMGENQSNANTTDVLASGDIIGKEQAPDDIKNGTVYLEVAIKGLSIALDRIQPNIDALRARLTRAKQLRLWGNLATAVTGVGLFTALLAEQQGILPMVAAVINFIGAACALFANHLETPAHTKKGSLAEEFKALVEFNVEAEELSRRLKVDLRTGGQNKDEAQAHIQRANVLVAELRRIELLLGTHQRNANKALL